MPPKSVERFTANVENLAKVATGTAKALTRSSVAVTGGVGSLAKACQDLAIRNFEKLAGALQALSSAKSPVEFCEIQQKLANEGFEAAVADGRAMAVNCAIRLTVRLLTRRRAADVQL